MLISYISDLFLLSLGRMVSPYTVARRSELISTGMSPLNCKGKEKRRSGELVRTKILSGDQRSENLRKRFSAEFNSSPKRRRGIEQKR